MGEKDQSPSAPTDTSRWSKQEFLSIYSARGEYGYGRGRAGEEGQEQGAATLEVEELRARDFPTLLHPKANPAGLVYLDHAGATLYSRSQIARSQEVLFEGVYGNPHSKGPAASLTADHVEGVRGAVLDYFHAPHEDWAVVFTSGATASFKLLAESFPWSRDSRLYYALNSHTSVLGMREYAVSAGASFTCLSSDDGEMLSQLREEEGEEASAEIAADQREDKQEEEEEEEEEECGVDDVVVLPAECNFSGRKIDLSLDLPDGNGSTGRRRRRRRRLWVVLDAAKHVATSPLDLSHLTTVDAISLSFYKIFGYPTGLGCLLVRRDLAKRLTSKHYFGGGTVQAALPDIRFQVLRAEPEKRLADGTENYLGIMAVRTGLDVIRQRGGMARVQAHTFALTCFLYDQLCSLRHANGAPACVVYGPPVVRGRPDLHGPVLAFNLLRPSGEFVGYAEVERLAELHGTQLRTGCFCNPGACMEALGMASKDVLANLEAGHVCWDDHDIIDGRPTGAIRASFGYMSIWEDATALLHFIDKYFLSKTMTPMTPSLPLPLATTQQVTACPPSIHLSSLIIYPIKSCAGMTVSRWPLGPSGLLFDREWAIVDANGRALRLKAAPSMCLIRPHICLESQEVVVSASGMEDLRFSLSTMPPPERTRSVSVCGEACAGVAYEAAISDWFTRYLKQPCTLVKSSPYAERRRARLNQQRQPQQPPEDDDDDGGEEEDDNTNDEQGEGAGSSRSRKKGQQAKPTRSIAFSNEAQFLLVSTSSVEHLNGLIANQVDLDYEFRYQATPPIQGDKSEAYVTIENFRPNLVVSGSVAHQEDLWQSIDINVGGSGGGGQAVCLRITGPCSRCSMVNIDHRDGSRAAPVLKTLATYRRDKAKICFGQFLTVSSVVGSREAWLEVGAIVRPVMPLVDGGHLVEV